MSEYKFRGKDLNGVWRHGSLVNNLFFNADTKKGIPYIFDVEDVDYSCLSDLEDGDGFYEVASESVGLCTGLKDKNGKEVYEGDIVCITDNEKEVSSNGEVKFRNGVFGVENWTKKYITPLSFFILNSNDDEQEYSVEVVGNIYDNRELLKKG